MKKWWITVIVLLVIIGGFLLYKQKHSVVIQPATQPISVSSTTTSTAPNLPSPQPLAGEYDSTTAVSPDSGEVIVYPASNNNILFYLQLYVTGDFGQIYGRATETSPNVFTYTNKVDANDICILTLSFQKGDVTVTTVRDDGQATCGLSAVGPADGTYQITNGPAPQYFVAGSGQKVYFKTTPPEGFLF